MIEIDRVTAKKIYNNNEKVYLNTFGTFITKENKCKTTIFTEQEWDFDTRIKAFEYYYGNVTFYYGG